MFCYVEETSNVCAQYDLVPSQNSGKHLPPSMKRLGDAGPSTSTSVCFAFKYGLATWWCIHHTEKRMLVQARKWARGPPGTP